ncbi:MAG: FAD-dependent oxidoreductase, partial [Gemmatimonadaceae bacterium]
MNNPFALLFEPVPIGPVVAPNRFYQVPHCNGFGHRMPEGLAEMRAVKAEGGWGVVCTEEVEIHHTSDLSPYFEGRLWDEGDVAGLARMAERVHAHGSLAAIELVHSGVNAVNLYSRATPIGPRSMHVTGGSGYEPVQTRRMDLEDFRNVRRWHRTAALRAREMGFDIVYVYAGHHLTLPIHLLSKRFNDRSDEYGGSLENRVRFLRELIEDTKEAVGDRCAVAVRLAVDELMGDDGLTSEGEGREIVAMLAELPDLWDVNISGWSNDSATSRFEKEGYQERYCGFVKGLTTKPVVGVGRYTSPDAMMSAIRRGVLDMIGAARASIADPFLPNKIREGRWNEIRECIGCNICVTADNKSVPIRCTQNPTMGEEWRRGWHPERIAPKGSEAQILVVGSGPAGLECARALGARGYDVTLAEGRAEFGGRVARESCLPGLNEWRRVIDWRLGEIKRMPNVALYPGSLVAEGDVLEFGASHVIVATGSHWRRDGVGRGRWRPIPGHDAANVLSPDDVLATLTPEPSSISASRLPPAGARVLVYDNEHYYMGGVLAEWLARAGCVVTIVTPAPLVSWWTQYTLEQERVQRRLISLGVSLLTQHELESLDGAVARCTSPLAPAGTNVSYDYALLATDRLPDDSLYHELVPLLNDGRLSTLRRIGDCEAPNIIAQAVFQGHLAAREFGEMPN